MLNNSEMKTRQFIFDSLRSHLKARRLTYHHIVAQFGLFILLLLPLGYSQALAEVPWHIQFSGSTIPMHRVVLKGQSSFDSKHRNSLIQLHQACLTGDPRTRGTPTRMEGTVLQELPEIVTPKTIELYYSSHHSLEVFHSATHTINRTTCEILAVYNTVATLFSAQGSCSMSADNQPAQGYCNERLKGMTLPRPSLSPESVKHMEQQTKTDEVRSFLGMPCEVKRLKYADIEKCIAKPPATAQPATLFTTPMHLPHTGLLLQVRSNIDNLDATEIQLSQEIPQSIFDVELNRRATKKLTGQRTL